MPQWLAHLARVLFSEGFVITIELNQIQALSSL